MTFKTTNELLREEQHHKQNLRRLAEKESSWRAKYADTAAWTIANINKQLENIRSELQMARYR
jgi:hypothetical protein